MGAAGLKNPGMLFTTPDCAQTVLREAGPANAAKFKTTYASGREIFSKFDKLGLDGFIINIRGPGVTQVLTAKACEAVAQWIAAVAPDGPIARK